MKNGIRYTRTVFLSVVITALVSACGGGGGGGPSIPESYDGETARAAITVANVADLVGTAWDSTQFGADVGESVPEFDAEGNILGDCGGLATLSSLNDDGNGHFSGVLTFSAFCMDGMTMDGATTFSGTYDPYWGTLLSFKLNFDNLDMYDAVESATIVQGYVNSVYKADGSGESATIDMVVRDNNLNKSYWMNGLKMAVTYGIFPADDTATITGRFYDYDYGYLDISTLSPLVIQDAGPAGGVLLFTGEASSARLTFNPDFTTLLEIDPEGDGTYVPAP